MAVFRIEKTRDYTVMSNHHLRDMSLSLKAKGLLSLMLSLPENWDYTMKGLSRICKDGIDSISGGIRELEEHGYLIRERVRGANGQLGSIEYTILEQPKEPTPAQEKPIRENPVQANPTLVTPVQEEPAQLNKDKSSNDPSRTDLSSTEVSNPIQSNPPTPAGARMGTDGMGARESYRELILENIEYDFWKNSDRVDHEMLDEITELIVDTVCSARKTIRIAGDDYPAEVVKSRFLKLDSSHVQYVMDCIKDMSRMGRDYTTTAIVGPSGSGKSTLCSLIARFYDVDAGKITLGETDIREFTCDSLLKNISMVFQNVYLFRDTIRNNIKFGSPDASEEQMIAAAKEARCHDFIMALPDGYDTVIGEGGSSLSGGEKQRISIARAMLKDAPIVILDEATASIDPENEHLIQEAISALTHGKTIITIAHRLATIENADQILVIDGGTVVQKGTHKELLAQRGTYQEFIKIREQAEGWRIQQ